MHFFSSPLLLLGLCCLSHTCMPTSSMTYEFLSVEAAQQQVVQDSSEGYFGKVTPLEMSIQLKQSRSEEDRLSILPDYKTLLQKDVRSFTAAEEIALQAVMDRAFELCRAIDPHFSVPPIHLIKTEGSYYGESVFYTRDNAIVIPAPLVPSNPANYPEQFLKTMLHEIFHVYSRYHPKKRDALYARIGFDRLPNLRLSEFLQKRVLYNPDGVDLRYSITVKDSDGRAFEAVPVIYSRYKQFNERQPRFFSHLAFQLFEIQEKDGVWAVVNPNTGYSIDEITGFWEQVERNTNYNIHPDELCADNFVLLAMSKATKGKNLEKLTTRGQQLVKDVEAIITAKD